MANASRGTVQFDVRKQTYSTVGREYLLMVVFEPARMALAASWLIPMAVVLDVSTVQAEKCALRPASKRPRRIAAVRFATTTLMHS